MKTIVDNYRGWNISFDSEKEIFHCTSDPYDREESKKSFTACKTFIDEFLKENEKFESFYVEGAPSSFSRIGVIIKIIGVRKDGDFIYEEKGEKRKVSTHNEDSYILINPLNKEKWQLLAELSKKIEELHKQKSAVEKSFVIKTLKQIKNEHKKQ